MILRIDNQISNYSLYFNLSNPNITIGEIKSLITKITLISTNRLMIYYNKPLQDYDQLEGDSLYLITQNDYLNQIKKGVTLKDWTSNKLECQPVMLRETTGDYRQIESYLSPSNKIWYAQNYRPDLARSAQIEYNVYYRRRTILPYQLSRNIM